MLAQRHLNFSISQRTVLVTVDMVRAALGVDADSIAARIDAGEIRWVWDVSGGTRTVRELRFWTKEIITPDFTRSLSPARAISEVLGSSKPTWRGSEIAHLLLVHKSTISRLHEVGELPGEIVSGTLYVPRAGLEQFLVRRLQNN